MNLHTRVLPFFVIAVVLGVTACAHTSIEQAQTLMNQGQYEQALAQLKQASADNPSDVQLKSKWLTAQEQVLAKLQQTMLQQRNFGQYAEAAQTVNRALAIDPSQTKWQILKVDLVLEQTAAKAVQDAQSLTAQGKVDQALSVVDQALKDYPRHTTLQSMQRSLQNTLRAQNPSIGTRDLLPSSPITLDFKNAPLSSVLETVTKLNGINFIFDRDVRQDARVNVFLRQAQVNDAIDLVLQSQQLTRRIIDSKTVLIYPNTPEKQKEHQELVVRVFYLANAEAKTTAALLKSMLKLKDPYIDERANLIAIREPVEVVAMAEKLVALHDIADAEVMLEVEVLEVSSSKLLGLGINFPSSLTLTPLNAAGSSSGLTLAALQNITSDRIGASVSPLTVNMRSEKGDTNVLANPRIRAKNREKAHIVIGDKVPVVTTTSSATGVIGENVSYLDVGLKLDVEPQVSPDDEVSIKIALEVSSITQQVTTGTGGTAYQIGTRNATTTLRLRDGETQILGGLINQSDKRSVARIPGLGDLPILGRLFGSNLDTASKNELILAITPRILRPAPRPGILQSQLWIGTEQSPRLQSPPQLEAAAIQAAQTLNTRQNAVQAKPEVVNPPSVLGAATTSTATTNVPTSNAAANNAQVKPAATVPTVAEAPTVQTTVSFTQVPPQTVGSIFETQLNMLTQQAIRGVPVDLSYDPQKLQVIEVYEGDLLKTGQSSTSFIHAVNTVAGKISVSILRSDNSGATPTAERKTLLGLRFKALQPGQATIQLVQAKPLGVINAAPIVVSDAATQSAQLTVTIQ